MPKKQKIRKLKPFDVIGFRSKFTDSWGSFVIQFGAKQRHTHVVIYLGGTEFYESNSNDGETVYTSEWLKTCAETNLDDFSVSRIKRDMTKQNLIDLVEYTKYRTSLNIDYDYLGGFRLAVYKWFYNKPLGKKMVGYLLQIDDDKRTNCCEAIGRVIYHILGIRVIPDPFGLVNTDDVTYLNTFCFDEVEEE